MTSPFLDHTPYGTFLHLDAAKLDSWGFRSYHAIAQTFVFMLRHESRIRITRLTVDGRAYPEPAELESLMEEARR